MDEKILYIKEMLEIQKKFDSIILNYSGYDYPTLLKSDNYPKAFISLSGQVTELNGEDKYLQEFFFDDQFSLDRTIAWEALADSLSTVLSFFLATNGAEVENWTGETLVWYQEKFDTVNWIFNIAQDMQAKNVFISDNIMKNDHIGHDVLGSFISYLVSEDDNFVGDVYRIYKKRMNRRAIHVASLYLQEEKYANDSYLLNVKEYGIL